MVDMDKKTCRKLAEDGFKNGLWLESYITWDFLESHPWAMEPRYFNVEWNTIPGLYSHKMYMRTLVIEKREWDQLSDPSCLKQYWKPTQEPGDFNRTLGLVLCWTPFQDCEDKKWVDEFVVSVAIVQKPSRHAALPFSDTAEEF